MKIYIVSHLYEHDFGGCLFSTREKAEHFIKHSLLLTDQTRNFFFIDEIEVDKWT